MSSDTPRHSHTPLLAGTREAFVLRTQNIGRMQAVGAKVRAVKWTYEVSGESWSRKPVRVSFSRAPFASGGMRDCYHAHEHDSNDDVFRCVAKIFKPECNAEEHEYFDEAMTQVTHLESPALR